MACPISSRPSARRTSQAPFRGGERLSQGRQADFVLSPWDEAEREALPALLGKGAADAVRDVTFLGLARAMNQHNSRRAHVRPTFAESTKTHAQQEDREGPQRTERPRP